MLEIALNPVLFAINAASKNIDTMIYVGVLGKYINFKEAQKYSKRVPETVANKTIYAIPIITLSHLPTYIIT